ncbi:TctA family transporter [Noviherbaspirillum humi]|uniref:TctA family transporter n=1 Tax=Noviherbaspirillum humi TaxID=1688639 RepID=A0A239FGN6_9BURK|nr:tripartite tricarboxylate transporter permease [Noviherbaspirillum humi]SNS56086.1 TctA family transporter [Noviherbaspirillum humi]
METLFTNLGIGFGAVLAFQPFEIFGMTLSLPLNLFYAFIGCVIGTLIGVLPGLGPVATIAMLLPATYALPPLGGLIMLAGIYYGAQYGGSTTAILVNLPGETSSVVTCIDGYQMARRGRAGVALSTAALGSFFAGCVGTLLLAAFAAPLAEVAFKFGPAEYFSLMVLGLIGAVVLASGSLIKAIAMICLGLLGGLVGTDVNTGATRYSFGVPELSDGIGFVAVAMGVFGFAEVIANLEQKEAREVFTNKVTSLFPTKEDFKRMVAPLIRGTLLGSALGILPGGGAALASFGAYSLEKKVSKNSAEFGKGAIEGVAAPESANNSAAQTSFIPLLTLGIPPNAVMALMVGAMTIHNIQPGPQVMTSNPTLFWGLIASMWVGNLMLVILNLPLIGMWVKLLTVPYRFLYPAILVFCCIGVYTVNNSTFDVFMTAGFGVMGYIFMKLGCEGAPLLLGFVLGPMMEENFRRSLLLSRGDFTVFFTRPLSLGLLIAAALLVVIVTLPAIKSKREEAFQEE